jgi:DNA-binding transcriptional LysR family regulator
MPSRMNPVMSLQQVPMRIRYIEIFSAVMQTGTVMGAAQVLHVSQPAATRLLQQAERHVGFALFDRVKGRLVATREARVLYAEIVGLNEKLASVKRLSQSLRAHRTEPTAQPLKILCVPSLARDWLPRALKAWAGKEAHAFTVRTLHSQQIEHSLLLHEADLGFGFESSTHPALVSDVIATGHLKCVGPGIKASIRRLALDDLMGMKLIGLDGNDPVGRVFNAFAATQSLKPSPQAMVQSYHVAIALASNGFGLAVVDSFSASHAVATQPSVGTLGGHAALRAVPIEPRIDVPVYALRHRDRDASLGQRRLMEALSEALQKAD